MPRMYCVLSLVLLLSLGTGCEKAGPLADRLSSKPSETVNEWYALLEKGRLDDASKMVSNTYKGDSTPDQLKSHLRTVTAEFKSFGGLKSLEIVGEEVTGQAASVMVVISYGNGTGIRCEIPLIKDGAKWLIEPFPYGCSFLPTNSASQTLTPTPAPTPTPLSLKGIGITLNLAACARTQLPANVTTDDREALSQACSLLRDYFPACSQRAKTYNYFNKSYDAEGEYYAVDALHVTLTRSDVSDVDRDKNYVSWEGQLTVRGKYLMRVYPSPEKEWRAWGQGDEYFTLKKQSGQWRTTNQTAFRKLDCTEISNLGRTEPTPEP